MLVSISKLLLQIYYLTFLVIHDHELRVDVFGWDVRNERRSGRIVECA